MKAGDVRETYQCGETTAVGFIPCEVGRYVAHQLLQAVAAARTEDKIVLRITKSRQYVFQTFFFAGCKPAKTATGIVAFRYRKAFLLKAGMSRVDKVGIRLARRGYDSDFFHLRMDINTVQNYGDFCRCQNIAVLLPLV